MPAGWRHSALRCGPCTLHDCLVIVSGMLGYCLSIGVSFSFGVYYIVLGEHFRTTRLTVSWLASLNTGTMYLSCAASSFLTARFGAWKVIVTAAILALLGHVLASVSTQVWHLLISYGLISGCGFGLMMVASLMGVQRHFARSPHLHVHLTLVACGTAVGTFLLPVLFKASIREYGWRGSFLIMSAVLAHQFVAALVFYYSSAAAAPPSEAHHHQQPDSGVGMEDVDAEAAAAGYMSGEWRSCHYPTFLLSFTTFYTSTVMYALLVDHAVTQGHTMDDAVPLLLTVSIGNLAARLACPALLLTFRAARYRPRMPNYRINLVHVVITGASMLLVALVPASDSLLAYHVFGFTYGFGFGGFVTTYPNVILEFFGPVPFGRTVGLTLFVGGFGGLVAPPFAGAMLDLTHTYRVPLSACGALVISGTLISGASRYMGTRGKTLKITTDAKTSLAAIN